MIELKNIERSYKTGHTETWCFAALAHHQRRRVRYRDGAVRAGKSSLLNVLALLDDGCSASTGSAKRLPLAQPQAESRSRSPACRNGFFKAITCSTISPSREY